MSNQHTIKIQDLVKTQYEVITLRTKDSVEVALEKLSSKNFTSAPVLDDNNKIWGFIDVVDIMLFLVKVTTKEQHSRVSPPSTSLSTDDIGVIAKRSGEFALSSLLQVLSTDQPRHDPYYPLTGDMGIQDAIEIFLRGVHRIAITNNSNHIVHILTQSNIIKYLAEDPTRMGLRAELKVSEFSRLKTNLVTITTDLQTVDAFKLMADKRLNSLAIVNKLGALVGSISATDLKGLKEFKFMRLLLPVSEFVAEIRKEQGRHAEFAVTCNEDSTLKRLVELTVLEQIHRIYLVDKNKIPLAVISLTDLIRESFL